MPIPEQFPLFVPPYRQRPGPPPQRHVDPHPVARPASGPAVAALVLGWIGVAVLLIVLISL